MRDSLCAHCANCEEIKYDGFMCDKTGYIEDMQIDETCKYFEPDEFTKPEILNKGGCK